VPALRFLFAVLFLTLVGPTALPAVLVERGNIDGVPYKVLRPDPPASSKNLLLHCHGYIPPEQPVKATYLPETKEPYQTLLAEGWTVAASSYRRNGLVIMDAMEDTLALLDLLERQDEFDQILISGSSMGGAIALLLLEKYPDRFDGGLILGRGLEVREPLHPLPFQHQLEDPVLLLTNQSETEAPSKYRESAESRSVMIPALWIVQTDGHIHFSNGEYREAVYALLDWLDGRVPAKNKFFRIPPAVLPTGADVDPGAGRIQTTVNDVSPTYGNLEILVSERELNQISLRKGDPILLSVEGASQPISALWVTTYSDVPVGAFAAFINEFGYLQVAVNRGSAAEVTGLSIGDPVTLQRPEAARP
jgi:pimeloyl-ACP methyl ester carboxylesterase